MSHYFGNGNIFKKKEHKVLIENFSSLSLLQIVNYVLPLIVLPYLIRVLGVEKFGLVMFAKAFIIFFNILVDYGFNLSATREISIHRDNKEKITEIFSSVIIIKLTLIIVSFILLSIIIFSFEKFLSDWKLYYLTFLWVIGQALFPIWYFQGMERMKYITFVNITSKVIFTLLIFIVIQNENDYIYVPLLNGFGSIIGGLLALWLIFKKFNQKTNFKVLKIKEHIKNGFFVFLSISSSTILSAIPAIFIGIFLNYNMVGYYSAFEKLVRAIKNLLYVINQTFFPMLSKVYKEDKTRYLNIWKKLSLITIIISVGIYSLIMTFSGYFIKLYLGDIFADYIFILYILAFSIILYTIINAIGLNGLLVIGKHKELSISQIIPTILFVLLSPILLIYFDFIFYLFAISVVDIIIIGIRLYFLKVIYYGKSYI